MRPPPSAALLAVLLMSAGCGGSGGAVGSAGPTESAGTSSSDDQPNAADAEATVFSLLSERPFTEEVTSFSGPRLPLDQYKQQVNGMCREITQYVIDNPKPRETAAEAIVVKWVDGLLDASSSGYQRIAMLKPPADREADIRQGFLDPYFDQLNAAERLYIDVIGGGAKSDAEEVLAEAQEAKKRLTVYAAKNDLTDCIG